jgi:hypothetical protein
MASRRAEKDIGICLDADAVSADSLGSLGLLLSAAAPWLFVGLRRATPELHTLRSTRAQTSAGCPHSRSRYRTRPLLSHRPASLLAASVAARWPIGAFHSNQQQDAVTVSYRGIHTRKLPDEQTQPVAQSSRPAHHEENRP